MHLSKLIKLYSKNLRILLYVKYISIKLHIKKRRKFLSTLSPLLLQRRPLLMVCVPLDLLYIHRHAWKT